MTEIDVKAAKQKYQAEVEGFIQQLQELERQRVKLLEEIVFSLK